MVVIVLALLGSVFSALEFRLAHEHLVGHLPSWSSCMKISVLGTLGNLLPIPGGTVVRVAALKNAGSSVPKSTKLLTAIGLIWLGLSLLTTGICLLPHIRNIGILLIFTGTLLYSFSVFLIGYKTSRKCRLLVALTALEFLVILNAGLRTFLVLISLGFHTSLFQSMALVASGSVAVAAGIVPAGLGIRELLAASIGTQVGIGGGPAFLASALNSAISILLLIPLFGLAQFLREKTVV